MHLLWYSSNSSKGRTMGVFLLSCFFFSWTCSYSFPDPDPNVCLLIAVNSKFSNAARRDEILSTWGSPDTLPPNVKMRFIIGLDPAATPLSSAAISTLNEASHAPPFSHYVPVHDEYRNNILKLLSFLEDIEPSSSIELTASPGGESPPSSLSDLTCSGFCNRGYTHILKVDDDTYVYLPGFLRSFPPPTEPIYLGQFVVRPPVRVPGHKNYVSSVCYPHSLYPPYAHGGAYLLSLDIVKWLLASHRRKHLRFVRDGEFPCVASPPVVSGFSPPLCCCDVDDVQLGLWLAESPFGPAFKHSKGFVGRAACHGDGVEVLFDVGGVMDLVHNSEGGGATIGGPCSFSLLSLALSEYEAELLSPLTSSDLSLTANNAAMLKLLLVSNSSGSFSAIDELGASLKALERAVQLEENKNQGVNEVGRSSGRNKRNADFLRPKIEDCLELFTKMGEEESGVECVMTVKEFVKKGIEAGMKRIQNHNMESGA